MLRRYRELCTGIQEPSSSSSDSIIDDTQPSIPAPNPPSATPTNASIDILARDSPFHQIMKSLKEAAPIGRTVVEDLFEYDPVFDSLEVEGNARLESDETSAKFHRNKLPSGRRLSDRLNK
jgi:hypothetical protein